MIKLWSNDFFHVHGPGLPDYADPAVAQRAFNDNIKRIVSLEALGFEGVFFTEHHFLSALSPNPNLLIAAISRLTKRLKLGVMGNVLAFHQPWRLAEDLSMLDYLTEGRLEIGMASGVPPEFTFVGIPQDDVRPMFAEVQAFIDMAYKDRVVTFHGKYYNYDDIHIMPRPRPEQRRRHWQTVYSPESCRKSARDNYKICTGYQSVELAAAAFDAYRDEADKIGRKVGPEDIGIRRQVLIWDTDEQAKAMQAEALDAARKRSALRFKPVNDRLEKAGVGMSEGVKQTGVIDADSVRHPVNPGQPMKRVDPLAGGGRISLDDEFIFGSPKTVADRIVDQCRRMGAGNLMAYHANALDEAQLDHHYDLWRQVLPIIQKAGVLDAPRQTVAAG